MMGRIGIQVWKHIARKNINKMSSEEASLWLEAHAARPIGIGATEIRDLTGGFSCQSIDFEVVRMVAARR